MQRGAVAIQPSETPESKPIIQLIVFRVANEEFGVPIQSVREIIKLTMITPIPDSPDYIKGLINVRGEIVAAIDLKARFSLEGSSENLGKHIVVTQHEDTLFGLMVDEVMEVLRVQKEDVKPPPNLIKQMNEDYVTGVVTYNDRLIIVLDLNAVLSQKELSRLSGTARKNV